MAEHTPGPWKAEKVLNGNMVVGKVDNSESIAEVWIDKECQRADAHLIAAAPDLRLALMGAATWTVDGYGLCWCEEKTDTAQVDQHEPACTGARAAIAKAEGRDVAHG